MFVQHLGVVFAVNVVSYAKYLQCLTTFLSTKPNEQGSSSWNTSLFVGVGATIQICLTLCECLGQVQTKGSLEHTVCWVLCAKLMDVQWNRCVSHGSHYRKQDA